MTWLLLLIVLIVLAGGWWGWSDGKGALEFLFWAGLVTTATRRGFERIYDLPERVLPKAVLATPTPEPEAAQRALLLQAARAMGVATARDLREYFRLDVADVPIRLAELVEAGRATISTFPAHAIQVVATTDRDAIKELLGLTNSQDPEALAARGNMTKIVSQLHDPASRLLDLLLRALRDGRVRPTRPGRDRGARRVAAGVPQAPTAQVVEQPSPPTALPSSQTSPPSSTPSPHLGIVQDFRHAEGVSNAWICALGPPSAMGVGIAPPSSNCHFVMFAGNVGAMLIVQLPGNGRPEMTPPSEFCWKFQSPCTLVALSLKSSLGVSSESATTEDAGRPVMSIVMCAIAWLSPVVVKSMPCSRNRLSAFVPESA